jgi:hypothetical protein
MNRRDVFGSHVEHQGAAARAFGNEPDPRHLSTWAYKPDGLPAFSDLRQNSAAIESYRALVLIPAYRCINAHEEICDGKEVREGNTVIVVSRLGLTHEELHSPPLSIQALRITFEEVAVSIATSIAMRAKLPFSKVLPNDIMTVLAERSRPFAAEFG